MRRKRISLHVSLVSRSRPIARYRIDDLRKLGDQRSVIEQGELDGLEARFRRIPLNEERERLASLPVSPRVPERHESSNIGFVPLVPQPLLDATAAGDVVLVMGAGVSAQASLPTARFFCLNVLKEIGDGLDPENLKIVADAIASGDKNAIETLRAIAGRERTLQAVKKILTFPPQSSVPELHQVLKRGKWAAVIGLTWDELDIMTFEPSGYFVVRAEDSPMVGELLRSKRPVLIKPIGDTARPETIALTWQDYREVLERWPDLVTSLTHLYSTQTLFFLGLSRESIEQFLNSLPPRITPQRPHYALLPAERGNAIWEAGMGARFLTST